MTAGSLSRRGFLGILGGLAVAPIVEPIAKAFFLSPAGGWRPTASGLVIPGNQLLTIEFITREALRILKANLIFTAGFPRQYDQQFATRAHELENTLDVRVPRNFVA